MNKIIFDEDELTPDENILVNVIGPVDAHTHTREDDEDRIEDQDDGKSIYVSETVPHLACSYETIEVMCNLTKPILDGKRAKRYGHRVEAEGKKYNPYFNVIPSIKLVETTTVDTVAEAAELGIKAFKVYPDGVTTNSEGGVKDFSCLDKALAEMEAKGIRLLVHAEHHDKKAYVCYEREQAFLGEFERIAKKYPKLKISFEHITSAAAIDLVKTLDNVWATVAPHYAIMTHDDQYCQNHNCCMPTAKSHKDRDAVLEFMLYGGDKRFHGTDFAPHREKLKLSENAPCGVGHAHGAELVVSLFYKYNAIDNLQAFMANNARSFYDLPPGKQTFTFVKKPLQIPRTICNGKTVSFMAGQWLPFSILKMSV